MFLFAVQWQALVEVVPTAEEVELISAYVREHSNKNDTGAEESVVSEVQMSASAARAVGLGPAECVLCELSTIPSLDRRIETMIFRYAPAHARCAGAYLVRGVQGNV